MGPAWQVRSQTTVAFWFAWPHISVVQQRSKGRPEAVAEFGQWLAAGLGDGTFVRLVLSPVASNPDSPRRVLVRRIDLKGVPHLSCTFQYATRDEVHNLPEEEGFQWIIARLGTEYANALLRTTQQDWQLSMPPGKRPRLIRHRASVATAPCREHDRRPVAVLDDSAQDWLLALGVTDPSGRVRPSMADKYSQINYFLEIFSHFRKEAGWSASAADSDVTPWTILDLGCGKGYLTFGLWHLTRRIWRLPVRVIGVELRPELVEKLNHVAQTVADGHLEFLGGAIESTELPSARVLMALHACDTATDDALRRGIEMRSQLILVAPCCHKQVRPQLQHPAPLAPVLRHGILEERMAEWATDGLRALFLEWAGYRTKVFEFIASEHTAKNLMIAGIRERPPFHNPAALRRLQEFKAYFGIRHHALDPLLAFGSQEPASVPK